MYTLCSYKCAYCERPIETSFVTLGGRHYHALENETGERTGPSCYEQSCHGTRNLDEKFAHGPSVPSIESAHVPA